MQLNNWLSRLVQSCPLPSLFLALILPPTASTGLSHALFLRSQGACYSSSNSTWQGDLCPTQDGLNWGWKGWGVLCPVSNPMVSAPLPPCPGPNTGLRGERERQWRQPAPLCWAPCWTLERGKRRGRERPTKTHTESPVYVYADFDRECTFSNTQKPCMLTANWTEPDRRQMWVRWVQMHLAHTMKLCNLNKMLSLL